MHRSWRPKFCPQFHLPTSSYRFLQPISCGRRELLSASLSRIRPVKGLLPSSGWQAADQEWPLFVLAGFFATFGIGVKVAPPTTGPSRRNLVRFPAATKWHTTRGPADFPSHDLGEELLPGVSSGMAFALNFASTKISAAVLFRGPACRQSTSQSIEIMSQTVSTQVPSYLNPSVAFAYLG